MRYYSVKPDGTYVTVCRNPGCVAKFTADTHAEMESKLNQHILDNKDTHEQIMVDVATCWDIRRKREESRHPKHSKKPHRSNAELLARGTLNDEELRELEHLKHRKEFREISDKMVTKDDMSYLS